MPHPVKKIYREFSPGAERKKRGVTLTAIKKQLAASNTRTRDRREFQKQGLLGA